MTWKLQEDKNLLSFLAWKNIAYADWMSPIRIFNSKSWIDHKDDYPILEVLDRERCYYYPRYRVRVLQHPNRSHVYKIYKVSFNEMYKLLTSIDGKFKRFYE